MKKIFRYLDNYEEIGLNFPKNGNMMLKKLIFFNILQTFDPGHCLNLKNIQSLFPKIKFLKFSNTTKKKN